MGIPAFFIISMSWAGSGGLLGSSPGRGGGGAPLSPGKGNGSGGGAAPTPGIMGGGIPVRPGTEPPPEIQNAESPVSCSGSGGGTMRGVLVSATLPRVTDELCDAMAMTTQSLRTYPRDSTASRRARPLAAQSDRPPKLAPRIHCSSTSARRGRRCARPLCPRQLSRQCARSCVLSVLCPARTRDRTLLK